MDVALGTAGAVTIAAIVVLGIFVYPLLLGKRHGNLAVAAGTVALTLLFYSFQSDGTPASRLIFAVIWALAPVLAAVITRRIGSKS